MDSNLKNLLCLQINVDKSKAASLVTYVQVFEHNYDLILVQDPYSFKVNGIYTVMEYPGYKHFNCLSSTAPIKSVIYVKDLLSAHMISQASSEHSVLIQITNPCELFFCSCYCPPSDQTPLTRLEPCFQALSSTQRKNLCLCTDSNLHSTTWFNTFTDRKGSELESLLLNNEMIICNIEEYGPTFENTQNGKSWIDLTAVGSNLYSRILNWKILEKESLSFHKFISFEVQCDIFSNDKNNANKSLNFKLTDWKLFNESLEKKFNENNIAFILDQMKDLKSNEIMAEIDKLETLITTSIKEALINPTPKRSSTKKPKSVPW